MLDAPVGSLVFMLEAAGNVHFLSFFFFYKRVTSDMYFRNDIFYNLVVVLKAEGGE